MNRRQFTTAALIGGGAALLRPDNPQAQEPQPLVIHHPSYEPFTIGYWLETWKEAKIRVGTPRRSMSCKIGLARLENYSQHFGREGYCTGEVVCVYYEKPTIVGEHPLCRDEGCLCRQLTQPTTPTIEIVGLTDNSVSKFIEWQGKVRTCQMCGEHPGNLHHASRHLDDIADDLRHDGYIHCRECQRIIERNWQVKHGYIDNLTEPYS